MSNFVETYISCYGVMLISISCVLRNFLPKLKSNCWCRGAMSHIVGPGKIPGTYSGKDLSISTYKIPPVNCCFT